MGLVVAGCLAATDPAEGRLVSADDSTFGAGALTVDTATRLGWLDLSPTLGKSVRDVQPFDPIGGVIGPASDFEGFRIPTVEEVAQLFANKGLTPGVHAIGPGDPMFDAAAEFVELLGLPSRIIDSGGLQAITSTPNTAPGSDTALVRWSSLVLLWESAVCCIPSPGLYASANVNGIHPEARLSHMAVWAVRPVSIPEPPTLAVLVVGMAGIGLARRRGTRG